jgi:hypothetical protein
LNRHGPRAVDVATVPSNIKKGCQWQPFYVYLVRNQYRTLNLLISVVLTG